MVYNLFQNHSLQSLTHLFPMHPFSTFSTFENIRKPYGFLMFSGGRERVHWEQMDHWLLVPSKWFSKSSFFRIINIRTKEPNYHCLISTLIRCLAFFIKNIFNNKTNLRLFYFHVTICPHLPHFVCIFT